ncbi:MAG: hypothetical protein K8L99_28055 [Anaerolineae bacterium]|nr:hypothetical protein [Anaerolineae bacterium]
MNLPDIAYWLSLLIALLALVAAGVGFFWRSAGTPHTVSTVRGQTAQIYGRGLYRYDTLLIGAGYKGHDAVVLFLALPLLLVSLFLSGRGMLAGHLLLTGVLGCFLYFYASMALAAAYNRLFLVYVALFSSSLFAFILTFSSVDPAVLAAQISPSVPQNGLAIFMIVSGLVTLVVWGVPLVSALIKDTTPDRLDTYTTPVTYALDLAIITPSTLIAGALISQGVALGYLIAMPLLVIIILLAPLITLSTIFQKAAGVKFSTGEMIGPVAGFVVLGLIAIWLTVSLLQGIGV